MSAEERTPTEEGYADLFAAGEEALARGPDADPCPEGAPAEVQERLRRDLACVGLLRQVLGPAGPPPSTSPDLAADSSTPEAGRQEPQAELPWRSLGRFELRRELGRGGMGMVYLAYDPALGREVALKVPRPEAALDPGLRARFHTEARAAAGLEHPNLVPVYEAGDVGPVCFLVSAYCPGVSLAHWLREQAEPVPLRRAAELVAQLAEGMAHAHAKGVVHRDLKPGNVLLTPEGTPKVTDFGLAKLAAEAGQTRSGAIVGTVRYMAPEQAGGHSKEVGPAADVWALGAILYELLTGRPPFVGESDLDTLAQVCSAEPIPPRRLRPRVPRDLETVCLKCLAKEPARRYAGAAALAEDLRRFLRGEPVRARPLGRGQRLLRWGRRHPTTAALLLVTGVALAAVSGLGVGLWYNARLQRSLASETSARRDAQKARLVADEALDKATSYLYLNRIALAYSAWQDSNIPRFRRLLRDCPADRRDWEWRYLNRLWQTERLALRGPGDPVVAVAFSRSGDRMATACYDDTVVIWDAATGRPMLTLSLQDPTSVAFSPDGTRLAAGNFHRTVRVWDAQSGKELLTLGGFAGRVVVAFSPDGMRLATGSGDLRLWDATSGAEVLAPRGHAGFVHAVAYSPDSRYLASGGDDGTVRLWDAGTGREVRVWEGGVTPFLGVAFSPDSRWLAAGGPQPTIKVWDVATGREVRTFGGDVAGISQVAFHPDGQRLASAAWDRTVRVWDVNTGREVSLFRGHTARVTDVAYSPDGQRLASTCADGTVKVWGPEAQEARTLRRPALTYYWDVALDPQGERLASVTKGGPRDRAELIVWDLAAGRPALTVPVQRARVNAVAFGPDGRRVATCSMDRTVQVWDARTGDALLTLRGHAGAVMGVAFSPDGDLLASSDTGGAVKVWGAADGRLLRSLDKFPEHYTGVAFSPDGRLLAAGSRGRVVRLWDVGSGELLRTLEGHAAWVEGVAFSPDGTWLAAADVQTVKLWDVASGREVVSIPAVTHGGRRLAFSRDGRRLVTTSMDGPVRIWDVATGEEALSLRGHSAAVVGVAFTPDGDLLVSADEDGTIRLWNAAAPGAERAPPLGDESP